MLVSTHTVSEENWIGKQLVIKATLIWKSLERTFERHVTIKLPQNHNEGGSKLLCCELEQISYIQ